MFFLQKLFLLTYHTCKIVMSTFQFSLLFKILKPTQLLADIRNITAFNMHLFRSIIIIQCYLFGLNYNQLLDSSKNTDMKK